MDVVLGAWGGGARAYVRRGDPVGELRVVRATSREGTAARLLEAFPRGVDARAALSGRRVRAWVVLSASGAVVGDAVEWSTSPELWRAELLGGAAVGAAVRYAVGDQLRARPVVMSQEAAEGFAGWERVTSTAPAVLCAQSVPRGGPLDTGQRLGGVGDVRAVADLLTSQLPPSLARTRPRLLALLLRRVRAQALVVTERDGRLVASTTALIAAPHLYVESATALPEARGDAVSVRAVRLLADLHGCTAATWFRGPRNHVRDEGLRQWLQPLPDTPVAVVRLRPTTKSPAERALRRALRACEGGRLASPWP